MMAAYPTGSSTVQDFVGTLKTCKTYGNTDYGTGSTEKTSLNIKGNSAVCLMMY